MLTTIRLRRSPDDSAMPGGPDDVAEALLPRKRQLIWQAATNRTATATWGGPWGMRRRRKLRCTAISEEPRSRNALFCWSCLRVDRSFVLRAVVDQVADRSARF